MAWICHPRIDDGQRVVEVPDESLPHHERAGWEVTDPPPPPPLPQPDPGPDDDPSDQTSEAPADAGASALPDQSPARRRTTRGDQ